MTVVSHTNTCKGGYRTLLILVLSQNIYVSCCYANANLNYGFRSSYLSGESEYFKSLGDFGRSRADHLLKLIGVKNNNFPPFAKHPENAL